MNEHPISIIDPGASNDGDAHHTSSPGARGQPQSAPAQRVQCPAYALVKGAFQVTERAMERQPYTAAAAPVEITAKARRLPQWTLVDDSPGLLRMSPVATKRAEETVTLVPYGAAKLRI